MRDTAEPRGLRHDPRRVNKEQSGHWGQRTGAEEGGGWAESGFLHGRKAEGDDRALGCPPPMAPSC